MRERLLFFLLVLLWERYTKAKLPYCPKFAKNTEAQRGSPIAQGHRAIGGDRTGIQSIQLLVPSWAVPATVPQVIRN